MISLHTGPTAQRRPSMTRLRPGALPAVTSAVAAGLHASHHAPLATKGTFSTPRFFLLSDGRLNEETSYDACDITVANEQPRLSDIDVSPNKRNAFIRGLIQVMFAPSLHAKRTHRNVAPLQRTIHTLCNSLHPLSLNAALVPFTRLT